MEEQHTIGQFQNLQHKNDSILVNCKYCNELIYIELENSDKIPVCINCAADLIVRKEMNITTQISKDDIKEFLIFLMNKHNHLN